MRVPPLARRLGALALALLVATPAGAVVRGKASRDPDGVRASVVRIESSGGELCSGVLIAPDLVLTAAHCVLEKVEYRVYAVDRRFRTLRVRAVAAAMHPSFQAGTTPRTQPGIDLALVKLERPLGRDFRPLDPNRPASVTTGDPVTIAGFGTTAYRLKASARTLRETNLVSLGELRMANRVYVAVDAERLAERAGAGACQGDSGGPILRGGPGRYQLVGIVSWSSGAFLDTSATACGGFTALTPLAEHASWIAERAAELSRTAPGTPLAPTRRGNRLDWSARDG